MTQHTRTRIIRLESPSATTNTVDNLRSDVFMPADGDKTDGDKNWFTKIFGTKENRDKRRTDRRNARAERKRLRLQKKSTKQLQIENAAKEKALALGKSQAEANAIAQKAGAERKAQEEAAIKQAEEKAKADALAKGKTDQEAEDLSNAAGDKKEKELFGGASTNDNLQTKTPMSKGTKIALIGGGVVVLGLIIWAVVASTKKK